MCSETLFYFLFFKEKPLKQGSRKSSFASSGDGSFHGSDLVFMNLRGKHGNILFKISFHHINE